MLTDENLGINKKRLWEFLDLLKECDITFSVFLSINFLEDPETVKKLVDAGCNFVLAGLESIKQSTLEAYNKGHVNSAEKYSKIIDDCRKAGLNIQGNFLFNPAIDTFEDIDDLVFYFLTKYSREYGKQVKGVTHEALEKLLGYPWPGNVRELENYVARAVAGTAGKVLTPEDFPLPEERLSEGEIPLIPLAKATEELEKRLIKEALEVAKGNQTQAARILQISRQTLATKIKEYGIKAD